MKYRGHLDAELARLKQKVIDMGTIVKETFERSIQSLQQQDMTEAQRLIDADEQINELEEKIMTLGATIIATQQPIARDMRSIIIAFKIANDLERMGDLAVDIAKLTQRIGDAPLIKPLIDIPKLADIVLGMVAESIQSYEEENIQLAYKMASTDDDVDDINNQILSELFVLMHNKPDTISQGMLLCFASRHLERIADYATNIGENVAYLVSGERPDLN